LVLVLVFAELAGCGGPTLPGPTGASRNQEKWKSVMSNVSSNKPKQKSQYLRKIGKNYVLELPARTREDE
jgi:hypothetical protein